MKLQFLGATRQVTGSQYLVQSDGAKILVDCGLYQERDYVDRNWQPGPFRARDIDALLLTHAHIDHCGLTPKLVQDGLRCPIITTEASADLVEIVLRDAAEIQMEEAAYKQKRHRKEGRQGRFPAKPLYTVRDVDRTLPLLRTAEYGRVVGLKNGISAVFHDAGHILGSAMVELRFGDQQRPRRLIFSGDIGQEGKPFVRDPSVLAEADYLVMESTYGDRIHEGQEEIESQLEQVIGETIARGGNVVVPVFAIERAQELIYYLSRLVSQRRMASVPVFLDSPMAADVTAVFRRHRDCFNHQTKEEMANGNSVFNFPGLKTVRSVEESKAINNHRGPAVILATSGMCTAGRIKFHLRMNLSRPESTILFVGYQARNTLGRQILDGNPEVRIHGRQLLVKARIAQILGFSGHADRNALLRWLGHFEPPPKELFLTHGEEEQSLTLAQNIRDTMGWKVSVPEYQQVVELC